MAATILRRMLAREVRLRAAGDGGGEDDKGPMLTGMGAVYDTETVVFGQRETIAPGAFSETLKGDHDVYSTFNHSSDNLLGRQAADTLTLNDTDEGLEFSVRLNMDTTIGRDVAAMAKRGDLRGASIAFMVPRDGERQIEVGNPNAKDPLKRMPKFEITKAELFEIGPVTDPAYTETSVDVRSVEERIEACKSRARPVPAPEVLDFEFEIADLELRARALED